MKAFIEFPRSANTQTEMFILQHYHFELYPFEEYDSCTTYASIIPVAFLSVALNTFLY